MLPVARSTCISRSIPLARKKISIIYYLLSIIYYLSCPRLCKWFLSDRSAGVTFVNRHKSNQKDFVSPRKSRPKTTLLCRACFGSHVFFRGNKSSTNLNDRNRTGCRLSFFVCETVQFLSYPTKKQKPVFFEQSRDLKSSFYIF